MSAYRTTLPQCFAYSIEMPVELARRCINELMRPQSEPDNYSSFAVTADTYNSAKLNLWMSEASYRHLEKVGLL